jgi:hypothetical protein
MYKMFKQSELNHIFRFKEDMRLITREGTTIEFKESFNWANKYKYAKTMAAFANNRGGFLVFGVIDKPKTAIGLKDEKFEQIDEETITAYLNGLFSPEIVWEKQTVTVKGLEFGIIYTKESTKKPIIAIANANGINESDILYRYNGRSERIKYPELSSIIENEREKEKRLWMEYIQRVSKIGLDNLAIIDLNKGKIDGKNTSIYIDEKVVDKLKFIKEGEFNETNGAPTLKLIGEVQEVNSSTVLPIKTKVAGIRTREIIEALLYGKLHENTSAKEYLESLPYEQSKFMPIFVFLTLGDINKEEAEEIFLSSNSTNTQLKLGLVERLKDTRGFSISYLDEEIVNKNLLFSEYKDFRNYTETNNSTKNEKKSMLYNLLLSEEQDSLFNYIDFESDNICEMISLLDADEITQHRQLISELMLEIFDRRYLQVRSNFRYAISQIDKLLYAEN